jgi:hypothetical protein
MNSTYIFVPRRRARGAVTLAARAPITHVASHVGACIFPDPAPHTRDVLVTDDVRGMRDSDVEIVCSTGLPRLAMRTIDPAATLRAPEPLALCAPGLQHMFAVAPAPMRADDQQTTVESRERRLALVRDDDVIEPAQRAHTTTGAPTADGTVDPPPLAQPLGDIVASLWASPSDLVELLRVANEQRRLLESLATAVQIGAVQLPRSLAERIDHARTCWPQALLAPPPLPAS